MINTIKNILKSVFLSWIVLFGGISNHPECLTPISEVCLQKDVSFSIIQSSVLPYSSLGLNAMNGGCSDGLCCEEQDCRDEKNVLISGQYQDRIKQTWTSGKITIFTGNKPKKLFNSSYQNKISKTNAIYILTQSFLC